MDMAVRDPGDVTTSSLGRAPGRHRPSAVIRVMSVALLAVAVTASSAWLAWWATHLGPNPIAMVLLVGEIVGVASAVVVVTGLLFARVAPDCDDDIEASFRYFEVVVRSHGLRRAGDVRRQLRVAVGIARRRAWR